MAFPQQSDPQIIHLFVDNFQTLFSATTNDIESFYSFCDDNCVKFLVLQNAINLLPDNSQLINDFIVTGVTNYGICDFSFEIDLFDSELSGLSEFNLIQNYNQSNQPISWITVKNPFWLFGKTKITYMDCATINLDKITVTLSNGVTTIDPFLDTVNNFIQIYGETRQIKQIVNPTTIIVDRPFSTTYGSATLIAVDVANDRILDYDTFIYRVKKLKEITYLENIKLEAYVARRIDPTDLSGLSTYFDRILIENGNIILNYCLYNENITQNVRQTLLYLTSNRTGTITTSAGSNIISGYGTNFENDLVVGGKIVVSGQVLTIQSINNTVGLPQQATIAEQATLSVNTSYSPYFELLPIYVITPPLRQQWLTTPPNSKSYADVYRFFTITGYTVGANVQTGNSPICYNEETDANIINSIDLKGLSIERSTDAISIDSTVKTSGPLCSICQYDYAFPIIVTGTTTTCDSAANGSITVILNPTNTIPPFTYSFSGQSGIVTIVSSDNFVTCNNLHSGLWRVDVIDSGTDPKVAETNYFTIEETFYSTIITSGNTIIFNVSGGTPTYYISSVPSGSFFESGLTDGSYTYTASSGTYDFVIGDSFSCITETITVTVISADTIAINVDYDNPTCDIANDGTIRIDVNSPGVLPYTYTFSKNGGETIITSASTLTNLTSGLWTVFATDASSEVSNLVNINLTSTFDASSVSSINSVSINVSGGTPPYIILGNTIPQFSAQTNGGSSTYVLPSGNVIFSVTDSNGCSKILPASIPINNLALDINILSYVNPNSDECANGEVVVSAIGGIPPYLIYSAVNSTNSIVYTNTTGIFTGLTSGFWDFTVTDSALVNNTASIGITLFTTYDVSYYVSGQTICVNASGGCTGYYSVFINGDSYLYDTGSTTNCFAALCGNNYIEVIDGNIADPFAISIVSGGIFTANTYVVCPLGLTYVVTPAKCEPANFESILQYGSVILTATGGTPPYLYYLVNPTNIGGPVATNYTGIFNNLDDNFPLLWTGYTIDISGNSTFVEFSVAKNFYKNIEQYGTGYCVTVSGGTAPYTILTRKNNNSPQRPQNQNNIPPGQIITTFTASTAGTYCFSATCGFIYSVVIMDANECPEDEEPINFQLYCPLELFLFNVTNVSCSADTDGSFTVYASGGQEPYISYSATNGDTTYVLGGGGSATFLNLSGGTWTVYVQDSVNQITSIEVDVNSLGIDLTTSINYSSKTWCIIATSFRESQYYLTIDGNTGNTLTILDGTEYCFPISGCSGTTIDTLVCRIPFAYQRLYDFSINEGGAPYGNLIRPTDGLFYGLTSSGGDFGFGTIFRYNPFTDALQVIHHFSGTTYSDGATPEGSLIRHPNGTFYGVTSSGGNGYGTIFSFDNIGNYNVLYRFNGTDGDQPIGTLARGTSLYGVTRLGGFDNSGVIFSCSISGTFTVLHEFDQTSNPDNGYLPYGSLLLYGGALYGTTAVGGRGFSGVLFRCTLSGNYTVLDEFNYGGNNLQNPIDGVIQTGGKFYGTTFSSLSSYGGIYSADTNGNIGKIYEFDGVTGLNPNGGLELGADGLLYGMTSQGGDFNGGTIYQIDREGLNIQKMHDFGNPIVNDGTSPLGRLFQASNRVLYGMTSGGGDGSNGTIFRIDPFDSICCSEETITIGDGIDFNITENYIGGVRNICVDIDVTNSFPPPYYVSINGYQNPYDSNNLTNCYPVNQCSEINVEACHLYFDNISNVLQFPNNFTGNTPYSLIYLNDKFYGTTRFAIFSCDTQGNNLEFLHFDSLLGTSGYGISASNDGTFLYGNKNLFGTSTLYAFDLVNRTFNILHNVNINDFDVFQITKPIIISNGKLYGFSKGDKTNFIPTYGSIYHYDFSSSTYTIDYIFSGTGITNPFSFPLEASNGLLYGLAESDSTINKGGIFSFDINTNTFNVVHQFQLTGGTNPTGGLVEVDGLLYGVCTKGGTYSGGTIFSYNITTNEVIHLHNFGPLNVGYGTLLNVNGILYGTASDGDITNAGIIFSYNTFNNEYKRLLDFPSFPIPLYGVNPSPIQQLIRINNDLYNINEGGGPTDNGGTIYKLGFESCCKSQTYPAITGFTGFTVSTNIIDAVTTEFCVNINEEIFFQPPYTIDFNGTVYTVTGTTGHCYTITGCGVFDIIVCSGVEGIQASGCCYEQTVGVACTDISLITSSINIPCGDDSGIISAFATGGTTLYTFELTNGINTYTSSGIHNQIVTFTGLTAGIWNLTVTDTASNTTTQQYNLSNFIVDYSYQGNQVCVSISSTTYTSSTFFVLVNGVSYGYDNSLSANCYTVTGCSNNQLFVYELITNNLPYTVIEYFTGTPITNSSYSTLIEPLDNVFYGTSGAYLFSANTQGNIAPIINFIGDQPRQYLYLNNGIIYGATTNGGINTTGIIFTCDTSGNYGTFFEPQFIYSLGRITNPPIFKHSNGLFYGVAINGINGIIYSCDTQNNGSIIFNQPLINSNITSIIEASNGLIYGIVGVANFIDSGQIFSADTLGNVGVLYTATWPPTPPEPSFTFTKLNEFLPGLIYSTSSYGGQFNGGTIFTFDLSGNINILHEFSGGNNDGFRPKSELFQGSNGLLYGTTEQGGQYGYGVVYSIDVYGNNFSILHHFEDSTTGYYPSQAVVEAANGNLYGITFFTAPGTDSTLLYELQAPYSGCSYFSTFDTICDLSLNTVTTNIPCFDNNGLISAIAFGGVPDYFYTLTNGLAVFTQTGTTNETITFIGLTAGTYTLTVVDSSTFTASTATTVYDLSNFDVTLSTSGNQVCIVVTSTTIPSQTYTVQLQGNSYSYTASTTGTCYTVTGCGLTNVVVCNDVDTTLFNLLRIFDSNDGGQPTPLYYSNNILYGVTSSGGGFGNGTIFTSDTSGNFGIIYDFSDGEYIIEPLFGGSNGKIYGVTNSTFSYFYGSIFTIDLYGNYNTIYVFSGGTYGANPKQLEESFDGYFYGCALAGGISNLGILYRIDLSGNNFTILHDFSGTSYNDGAYPLNLKRYETTNLLYGTTINGGTTNNGTIFSCDTLGNYGIIFDFNGTNGSEPTTKLVYDNNGTLYGVTLEGGAYNEGTIFSCDTQGNHGVIHTFNDSILEGKTPYGELVIFNNTLYGVASEGGQYGYGTIFSCTTNGDGFQVLHNFDTNIDGELPLPLIKTIDGNLYGLTSTDSINGYGTFYKLNINPEEPCCFYGSVDVSCTLYLNTISTNIPCFDNSGVISVLGFGGYPNYEYTLSGLINGTATGTTNEVINFTGLTPGFYTVTVTDISGNSVSENYDLTNFDVIVNFDINTAQTGNEICIILTSTTLTANTYYVEIQGNVYTYDTSSLTGNCYTVTGCGTTLVTISGGTSGCTYNTSVDIPCNLVLYTYYTNIPCETDSGVIQVVGYGGIPTYTFTLVGPTTTTTVTGTTGQIIDFTGLTSGQYNVSVIDTIGFTQASAVTVFNLSYFDASVVAIDNQICVTISGESLTANTYVVNIDGFLYNYDTSSLTGNCYTVTGCGTTLVTISGGTSGCTYNASVDVSCTLLVDVISSSIPCEDNSGIISLLGFGGTPDYTYTITNGFDLYSQTGTTNQTVLFSGLTSGVYSINVTDSGGLTASTAATVINLSYFDVIVTTNDDQVCVTISADSITANTYVVNIDGFLYNYDTSSLTGNCYTVTGCGLTSVIISGGTSGCTYQTGVEVSCDLLLNVTNTSIPCENNSGIISVLAFGGTPDYSYLITNGVSNFTQTGTTNQTVTFTGLTSGAYSVSVTDSGGLTASTATTVLNLSYFDVDVTTNDDKICIVISADVITATTYVVTIGNDVYSYDTSSLTGNCYTVTGCGLTTVTISGGTSGCTYQTGVEVSCNLLLNISSTNIPCEDNSGTVSVLAFAGTPNYSYTITNGLIFATQTGTTNQTVTFSGLSAGLYNINVIDNGGLTASTATTVVNLSIFDANVTLNGNQLSVSVSSNTITAETYNVNVGGTIYPYNINTNPNLFTISGCGTTDVTITSFIQGPINYENTLLEFNDNNFEVIQTFPYTDQTTNYAGVVEVNKTLYGIITGIINNFNPTLNQHGLIYSCDLSGNNLTLIYKFSGSTSNDGSLPYSTLLHTSDGYLVGVTRYGGALVMIDPISAPTLSGYGTIFKYEISSNTFSYIHILDGYAVSDGNEPGVSNLLEINGTIYGTTQRGGFSGTTGGFSNIGNGTIFTCSTSGNYGIIHSFTAGTQPTSLTYGNDGNIYGTTFYGPTPETVNGILYKIDLNGNFTFIRSFSGSTYGDGQFPISIMSASNGILYGTTSFGGVNNNGTIFSCDTLGNYGVIHHFLSITDGRLPGSKLKEYYNTGVFFGTCTFGGSNNLGTIYTCNTIGDFGVIHHFSAFDGLNRPLGGELWLASNQSLYGTGGIGEGIYTWMVNPLSATTVSSCTYTTTIDIPCSLTLGVVSSSIPCDDDSGIISLIASAGTPYYTYTIVGPGPTIFTQTGDTGQVISFSGLAAGIYNISVIDNGGLTASTAATIYNLSFFDVDVNVNGNQICLTISSSTLSADTYFVQIQGTTYTYDTTLSANCYTVTGCGPTDITVVTGAPGIASEYEYSILHHFSGTTYGDGMNPFTNSIIYYDNQLYGTTRFGGFGDGGTIFRLNEDGSNYQVVASFTAKTDNTSQPPNIRVGQEPVSRLIIGLGNTIYGSTAKGGYFTNAGTLFSCDTTTGVISVPNGGNGFGGGNQGLTLHSNGKFYRASSLPGSYGSLGMLQFGGLPINIINLDGTNGSFPYDGLTEYPPTGILYGLTHDSSGLVVPIGNYGGVMFSINPAGTVYNVLYEFSGTTYGDGANPFCRLFLASNNLFYGTTEYGGTYDAGTIFTCNTSGNCGIIHNFAGFAYEEGENPMGTLTQDPTGKLYGITQNGGIFNFGTVFTINQDGSNYEILHHFSGRTDGATDGSQPKGEINYINGSLYGMTFQGGNQGEFFGNGVIYKLSVFNPPVTGCSFNTTVNIPCGTPLDIFTTIINVPCNEGNGVITTTVTGGSPNYQYVLTNGVIGYTQVGSIGDIITFGNLTSGVWTLTVTDSLGETITESYNISTYNVTINTGLTNNEVCISISGATLTGDTFYVIIQGITYTYDAFAPFNCFTLTGCGTNTILITQASTPGTGYTYEVIHRFVPNEGTEPRALIVDTTTNTLYGGTGYNGSGLYGSVFSCTTTGDFGVISQFIGAPPAGQILDNMTLYNGIIYGYPYVYNGSQVGAIFSCSTTTINSIGYIKPFNFVTNGGFPSGDLLQSNNGTLYGTLESPPAIPPPLFPDQGIIFSCSTLGNYGILHLINGTTEGRKPNSVLSLIDDSEIYGSTSLAGQFGFGTIYRYSLGGNFDVIHDFGSILNDGQGQTTFTKASDGMIYGTTAAGGSSGGGTIFKIDTTSIPTPTYQKIFEFDISIGGITPLSTLLESSVNGLLYGTLISAGDFNGGTIFSIDKNGNNYTTIHHFSGATYGDGKNPIGKLIEINGEIYGITTTGGFTNNEFDGGTIYKLTLPTPGTTGCTFEGIFEIPCPPLEIFILNFSAFCYNGLSQVIVGATGGTQPYTIILNEIFPTVTAYTATTIFNTPTIFPYNWAEFYVPAGGTYYGTVIDTNGDIIGSQVITTTNTYNVNINFNPTNVVVTINGNAPFGYSTINLNGTLYGNFPDGTYTYPISCGTNTVIVDGYVYLEGFYLIACTYSGSTVIPCDLTCDVDFIQPQCSGTSVNEITVFISGGTSPYDITIERPITNVIYSATTSTSPFVMTGLNLTQGGWTVVVTDANGDTCINEIFVDTTFDAIISSISTTGFCITISGGTPLYSIEIDKTDMGGNIYNDGTYCFTASCGTHEVVVSNPFASPPCPIELNFEIPCPELDCQITFTDPTCGKEDGGVIITVNGGVPPYFYQITDGTITYDSGSFLPTNTYTFNNLGVGTWVVTVGDSSIPRQKCDTTIVLQNSFQVIVSAYTATSLTYGLICFDISGGLPPYTILIDNTLVGSGLTPTGSLCYTATCGVNHSYVVFDSGNPCIEYVNQPIFTNSSFDTTSDWLQPYIGVSNCTNPTVNPVGFLSRYAFIDTTKGAFVYTALTSALVSLGGCFQNVPLRQNFIFPYTTPLSVTYSWQIGTGLVSGISPGYLAVRIDTPFGGSVPTTAPPFPGLQSYRSYSGIHTQSTTTVPLSGIYSGYSFNLVESGGYSANTGGNGSIFEITGAQLTILSYTLPCPCAATGTTFVPCFTSLPIITVVSYQNPPCLVNPDGIIVVSGSSGAPPYTYSATNGTTSYSNTTGIFTGLTEGIWYLSLIDSLGQVSTTTEVVTLNYTFFANVDVSLTGFCITISGGTLPYNIIFDGNPLPWNYSNITNCYTADCQTTAVIIVQDSSG